MVHLDHPVRVTKRGFSARYEPGTPASRATDAVTLALCIWLIGAMFLDGYAHVYVIDVATEDFFTPWHGLLYAAFVVLAAWVAGVGYSRRGRGGILAWFPTAYRRAALGVMVFAIGAVGDGIWHTVFGIELGIDALLSPTHLVLFAGGTMLLWTPFWSLLDRRQQGDGPNDPTAENVWPAVGSALTMTALLVFLLQYLWDFPYTWFASQPFNAGTGEGQGVVAEFLGTSLVSTAVLVGPLLVVAARFRLPFGAATVCWGVTQLVESAAFSRQTWPILVASLAGLVFDLVYRLLRPDRSLVLASALGPAALWIGYLLAVAATAEVRWPPEIWGGLVILSACAGAGLALLQQSGRPATLETGSREPSTPY